MPRRMTHGAASTLTTNTPVTRGRSVAR